MSKVTVITIKKFEDRLSEEELDSLALRDFGSCGKLEFDIEEAEIDRILGKEAYCGGDIPGPILTKLQKELHKDKRIKYYWQDKKSAKGFQEKLQKIGLDFEVEDKVDQDWNKYWRQGFKTIMVTKNLKVVPSWEKENDERNSIYIYPGMGFGTGNHETTFLCLKLFEEIKKELTRDSLCLDFGCGSGILGIAALKTKEMLVDFIDIDSNALDNCVVNLKENEFTKYREGHGVILRDRFSIDKKYDLVFANILENILEEEKEVLLSSLAKGGFLIVSGLLSEQEDNIRNSYNSLIYLKTLKKGDWIAILFKRN